MRFLVTTRVFETITTDEEVRKQAASIKAQIEKIMKSGKMVEGGQFGDQRGHFFLIDVDSASELLELPGRGILDHCTVETHPIMSFENLFEFFDRNPVSE